MKRTAPVLALASILGLAPLALAGGVAVHVTLDKSQLTPDAKGVVTLALGIERGLFDCGGTGLVAPDEVRPGPKVWIEQRTKKGKWAKVENAWARPEHVDFRPRDTKTPYRIDRGDRLRFSRWVQLMPGTYRVRADMKLSDGGHTFELASTSFEIVAAKKAKKAKS